ncbi:glycosyltransferase family 4 protein [Motilibacter rhizosphaerae]|nr:glycosyltransferase family 4 protein [Motilibacter rhizosphaerae]
MLVTSDVAGDSRVVREATTLAAAGHEVTVVGRDVPAGWERPAGVTVLSASGGSGLKRPDAPATPRVLPLHLRAARWALLPRHNASVLARWTADAERVAGEVPADVVHAHDFNTLELGARLADRRRAQLVYDSHEFWSGRPRTSRPTPLAARRAIAAEAALGARADAVITVGDGVARLLRGRFGWDSVDVVRNTFPGLEGPPALPERPVGAVYSGRMAPYRELEAIAAASREVPELRFTAIGPADPTWLAAYEPGRVEVRPSVPLPEAEALLASQGLALVTHSARWPNHRVALPNKLFSAVRVGAPVVATDVEELAKVVRAHDLGTLYAPGDARGLARAVREAVERWPELCANVRAAQAELSWEVDGATLLGVYERLATRRSQ